MAIFDARRLESPSFQLELKVGGVNVALSSPSLRVVLSGEMRKLRERQTRLGAKISFAAQEAEGSGDTNPVTNLDEPKPSVARPETIGSVRSPRLAHGIYVLASVLQLPFPPSKTISGHCH
jgi:hypothetical protein